MKVRIYLSFYECWFLILHCKYLELLLPTVDLCEITVHLITIVCLKHERMMRLNICMQKFRKKIVVVNFRCSSRSRHVSHCVRIVTKAVNELNMPVGPAWAQGGSLGSYPEPTIIPSSLHRSAIINSHQNHHKFSRWTKLVMLLSINSLSTWRYGKD